MKKNRIALYIDLLFCLVIMPLAIMLLPVDRWIAHNTAFLLTLVAYVYLLYFVYRHFMNARDDDAVREKVQFALISTAVIQALDIFHWMTHGTLSHWDQICICKAYSREIEYDEENTECLSNFIFDT